MTALSAAEGPAKSAVTGGVAPAPDCCRGAARLRPLRGLAGHLQEQVALWKEIRKQQMRKSSKRFCEARAGSNAS
jgi:hypothetical protein